MNQTLQTLFGHHHWANLRLFDACIPLPESLLEASVPGTYGSIQDTLQHVVEMEETYLAAIQPGALASNAAASNTVSDLRRRVDRSGQALIAFVREVADDHQVEGTRGGQPFVLPVGIFLAQTITHAAEHRNQIATIVSRQGVTPPIVDAWTYARDATPT
jgi:uncharacterized damage-inducible protein DinB